MLSDKLLRAANKYKVYGKIHIIEISYPMSPIKIFIHGFFN